MRNTILALTVIVTVTAFAAATRGTPAEAKAMLDKAAAHYKAVGAKQALADFTARKPPFFDRDLYVFCVHSDGLATASGGFPQYVGTYAAAALKDANGKPLMAQFTAAAQKGETSVEYPMLNPVTHKLERKIAYVQKLGADICGVGAYKP